MGQLRTLAQATEASPPGGYVAARHSNHKPVPRSDELPPLDISHRQGEKPVAVLEHQLQDVRLLVHTGSLDLASVERKQRGVLRPDLYRRGQFDD